jgi:asparagine synthase (glutamine-hydrolysing)
VCGICGTVGLADEPLIEAMSESIAHRGPDGQGTRCFPSEDGRAPAAFGHRRLSIIDPTPRGAQPMAYADGRYWITYNGELYNFRELREELVSDGYSFDSDCDTEVMLAMYARHGAEMVSRLNGIFAFAIWDTQRRELFMARDRLGVKPLYYSQRGDTLYFASEVKALLEALPPVGLRPEMISDYLTFLWVPDPDTLFEGVYKLPPGHHATFAGGRLVVREYWDLIFAPDEGSAALWAERVREGVGCAVRRQMVSDVPLGSFLSGGIDSSAIVNELTRARDDKLTTYTVGFSREDLGPEIVPDDVRYSRVMAGELDLDYHEQTLEPDIVDLLPRLVWHMDEPIADSAPITTYLICSAARERLTVIMSGMGGDELFAGYPRHLAARIGRIADIVPAGARRALRHTLEGRLTMGKPGRLRGPRRNAMKLLRGIDGSPEERYLTYCSYYRSDELARVLSPELRAATGDHDPFRRHREYLDRVREEHWLNRLLYLDAKTFLPCLNLAYTDKMSMAASTEVRVPLLDDEMVELAARIPPELKLRQFTRKYVFKQSQQGRLPRDVIWRPKAGFGAPVRSWLVGDLKPMVEDLLSPSAVAARGLFDPAEVQRLIRANEAGTEDNALRLWELVTLELWQRTFLDSQKQEGAASPRPVVL